MSRRYFVDAWYFIARIEQRDAHHAAARSLGASISAGAMITHEGVLAEVLAYFADEGSHARTLAAQGIRRALAAIQVVSVDRSLFVRAVDLYEDRPDKEYSLTDCISMVIMRDRKIAAVLTNDHHFRQEGFTVLSGAP